MKKILLIVALAIASLTMSAKEVSRNNTTGMVLDETAGVFSLMGKGGVIVLGGIKDARNFMAQAQGCFTKESLKGVIDLGDQKYTVKSDDEGMYIIKLGVGGVKVRPTDTSKFLIYLESRIVREKSKKVWDVITE